MKDKTKLIFKAEKDLWTIPKDEFFVWTTMRPSKEVGKVEKNSILVFNRLSPYRIKNEQPLEFIVLKPGNVGIISDHTADFFEYEINDLDREGALILLDSQEIEEMTITLSALGEIFIRKTKDITFDGPVLLPKDIYVVMGMREFNRSNGKLSIGDKISFQKIIDEYSDIIGKYKRW